MTKLHAVPPRILNADGKPIYDPSINRRSADIIPKPKTLNAKKAKPEAWKARKRQPGEAMPQQQTWSHGTYRTGDGEVGFTLRPGADDHKKWKSLGYLT